MPNYAGPGSSAPRIVPLCPQHAEPQPGEGTGTPDPHWQLLGASCCVSRHRIYRRTTVELVYPSV